MRKIDGPVTEAEQQLINTIYRGYQSAAAWPNWQYVRLHLLQHGIDGSALLQSLPTWQHSYRYVWSSGRLPFPEDGEIIGLSIAGLAKVNTPRVPEMAQGFLGTLAVVSGDVAHLEPLPNTVVDYTIDGEALTKRVNKRAGVGLSAAQLYEVLNREPATWGAVHQLGEGWTFEPLNPWLWRVLHARNLPTYLDELDAVVGIPESITLYGPIDPLMLPEAFDHLDLAWQLLTGKHLLQLPRTSLGAKLALPVSNRAEWESALSALSNVLDTFKLDGEGKSMQRFKAALTHYLSGGDAVANEAVDTLRHIIAVRAGSQHHGAEERSAADRTALGLDRFGNDWAGMWDQVRGACVEALRTIREQLEPVLPT